MRGRRQLAATGAIILGLVLVAFLYGFSKEKNMTSGKSAVRTMEPVAGVAPDAPKTRIETATFAMG